MSCLRDVHFIRDTQGETAYHASIAVAFIVETIKIACRVAAQPARRTHTAAAASSRAGASQAGNRSTADRSRPDDGRHRGGDGRGSAGAAPAFARAICMTYETSAGHCHGDRQGHNVTTKRLPLSTTGCK